MPYKDIKQQKDFQHEWYLKNKTSVYERSSCTRSKRRQKIQTIKDVPCVDCGIKYHYCVMQFDHRPEFIKVAGINTLLTTSTMEAVLNEIKKCDVVCANCHAMRTFKRRTNNSLNSEKSQSDETVAILC